MPMLGVHQSKHAFFIPQKPVSVSKLVFEVLEGDEEASIYR
jgi:hypothetical protein